MKLPLFRMYWDQEDIESVTNIIKRGSSWAGGPEMEGFEEKLNKFMGKKHTSTFNSGTSALHCMFLAHDLKDSEVIVPSFTFISTANAVILAGGTPVFADIEKETFGLDVEDVKRRITSKTKAVVCVHYAGCPARDTEKIQTLCKEKGILFFEDAAEALGATINGKQVCSFSNASILSFCQNKIIATGEGGAVVTNSKKTHEKLRLLRSHGRNDHGRDYFSTSEDPDYLELGFNFRMPTMCSALGISQMNKIDTIIQKRQENASILNKRLEEIEGITVPKPPKGFTHVYQLYTLLLDSEETREGLRNFLTNKGVLAKVYFSPAHLTDYYKQKIKSVRLPVTEEVSSRVLTIPLYVEMSEEEIDYIVNSVKEFFKGDRK